jgi:hypothetical protein
VPNLPFKRQMNWLNRHFCMLAGQGTDGVAKIEYVPGSDNIHEAVTQPTSSFKQTFAGMMVPVSMLEGKHPATPSVAEGPLDEGPDEGTFETAADGSHDDPNEASEDDHAEIKSPGPSSCFDLLAHWCRSVDRRTSQSITFEPVAYGECMTRGESSDHLNIYSGLPYDGCLALGSTFDDRTGSILEKSIGCNVDDPEAIIDYKQAAYIALKNPVAQFKGRVPKGAAVILRHIEQEVCGGDLEASLYLLRSIAYGLRYRKKSGVMMIIVGEKGTGKSTIFGTSRDKVGLIPRLYGKHWKEMGSLCELMEPFSDKQELECMMVTLEEVSDFGGSANARRFKTVELLRMLTSGTKGHTIKHQTKNSCVKDYRNFVALINPENKDAFDIQQGDRRLAMIQGSDAYSKRAQDENKITADTRKRYFAKLWQAIEDEACVQWIARYFVHDVCLDDWAPEDIPKTRVRAEQQELNACPVLRFLEVWQAQSEENGYALFYDKQVPKTNIHGVNQSAFEEESRPLEASPSIQERRFYAPADVFQAFKYWCKKTGASTPGASNVNNFGQKLAKYLYDDTKSPDGILHKKKLKTGYLYWIYSSPSSN